MHPDPFLARLEDRAGPVGPGRSFEDSQGAWESWVAGAPPAWADRLLALLVAPPPPSAAPEDWRHAIEECLDRSARADVDAFLRRVAPALKDSRLRPTVLNVLANLRDPRALPLLDSLLGDRDLKDEDLAGLAFALGEIGGPRAENLLRRLGGRIPATGDGDLQAEIGAALALALALASLPAADRAGRLGEPYAPPADRRRVSHAAETSRGTRRRPNRPDRSAADQGCWFGSSTGRPSAVAAAFRSLSAEIRVTPDRPWASRRAWTSLATASCTAS